MSRRSGCRPYEPSHVRPGGRSGTELHRAFCAGSGSIRSSPSERGRRTPPFEIRHGTTIVALRYVDGVVMAGDRRATAGSSIAHRTMEKVHPADRHSGVAIAGAAGPGHGDGEAVPAPARALREGRRGRPSAWRAKPTSCRRWSGRTWPWPCRASSSCRSSPATTCAAALAGSTPTTRPAAATRRPTSTPTAPGAVTPGPRSSSAGART